VQRFLSFPSDERYGEPHPNAAGFPTNFWGSLPRPVQDHITPFTERNAREPIRKRINVMFSKKFWQQSAERAAKTFLQVFCTLLGANQFSILNAPWITALSTAAMAAVLSLLTSLASEPVGERQTPHCAPRLHHRGRRLPQPRRWRSTNAPSRPSAIARYAGRWAPRPLRKAT
jgi:hypothetical protein